MDDILFSALSSLETQHMFDIAQLCLKNSGLIIAPEKIQTSTPYHYLGFVVNRQCITPQLTQILTDKLSTLNDFQKLLGDINWIRPSSGIANYQLNNLFNTLKGDPDLNSRRSLSQEAREELYLVQNKLQKQFPTRMKLDLPLELFILPSPHSPTGLLAQQEHPVDWIYTRFRGIKSLTPYLDLIALIIINGRNRTKTRIGSDPHKIIIPINKSQFENSLQTSTNFQIAFLEYFGEISFHYPSGKLWNFFKTTEFIISRIISSQPIYHRPRFFSIEGTKNGMMLKQYFGHLMRRVDSLEKTLMLGGIGGRRRRGNRG